MSKNTIESGSRITTDVVDFSNLALVQNAMSTRLEAKKRERKAAQEIARAEALMPELKSAIVDLLNSSISAVQPTPDQWIFASDEHNYEYTFRIPEDKESFKVSLHATSDEKTNKPNVKKINKFVINPPEGDERLKTTGWNSDTPQLEHYYRRDPWNNHPETRSAKDSDVLAFTALIKGLQQGLASGVVKVKNNRQF